MLRGRAARVPSYNAVITIPVFAKPIAKTLLTKQRRKTLSGSKSNIYNKVITIDVFWAEEPELKR